MAKSIHSAPRVLTAADGVRVTAQPKAIERARRGGLAKAGKVLPDNVSKQPYGHDKTYLARRLQR